MSRNDNIDILNRDFPSDKDEKKGTVDTIAAAIAKEGISLTAKKEEIYLSIDEAVTNAMEHGNGWHREKPVAVKVLHGRSELKVIITDQGKGFNFSKNKTDPIGADRFEKRGRGLFIISKFCDISWNKKGNSITLSFPLKTTS